MINCEITYLEIAPLSDPVLFASWLARMPKSRREKVSSLRHTESQRLSLGVGILLYLALEKRGIDGTNVEIRETEFGQPYLPAHPEIHFSLSHCAPWAMCALGPVPLGCDVERAARGNEKIANRFYHPAEQAYLASIPPGEEWDRAFAEIWTRKESYLKATGRGLSLGMDSFQTVQPQEGVWYDGRWLQGDCTTACCVFNENRPEFTWRQVFLEMDGKTVENG